MFKEIETFISKKKRASVGGGGGGGRGGKKGRRKKFLRKRITELLHLLNDAIDHICSKQRSNQIFQLKIKMIHVRKVVMKAIATCFLHLVL